MRRCNTTQDANTPNLFSVAPGARAPSPWNVRRVITMKTCRHGAHAPPGAPNWQLPPPEAKMVFIGLSPRALCEAIKDKRVTRGRDLNAMLIHVRDDKLVGWGWNPGGERSVPPVSRPALVTAFEQWIRAGAPCPAQ